MTDRLYRLLTTVLFTWVAVAGLFLAWHDSLTTDEGVHMASGYTILTRHDYRFDPEHTPLFKEITALPLLAIQLQPPSNDAELWNAARPTLYDAWQQARQWSDEWLYRSGNPADLMKFLARIPAVASLLGLCYLLLYLANQWFGRQVAVWTLFFSAFNPTLLAHGHLANDDVAVATAIVFGIAVFWHYVKSPTLLNSILVGVAVTIAVGTKFTGLGLLPLFFVSLIWLAWQKKQVVRTLGHGLTILLTLWIGIWILYGFHSPLYLDGTSINLANKAWHIPYGLDLTQIIHLAQAIQVWLPIPFVKGLIIIENSTKYGRGGFLFGTTFYPSLWYYFPAIIALKTQVIALILILVGLLLAFRSKARAFANPGYQLLGISLLVFGVLVMNSKLDLGIRYATPVLALAMPYLGLTMVRLAQISSRSLVFILVIILYTFPVLGQFPNVISFSSELVQPYTEGWRYMNDSNIDWGQEASEIAFDATTNLHTSQVATNYSWSPYQLAYYGLKTTNFDPQVPPTNTLILVTANQLSKADYCRFRHLTPIDSIANTAFFYRIIP